MQLARELRQAQVLHGAIIGYNPYDGLLPESERGHSKAGAKMSNAITDPLKQVVESQHGGKATFVQAFRVLPEHDRSTDWDGVVYMFDLKGHPKAKRAYAWSCPISGGTIPRYFAVLHMGKVIGPMEAVKAAAVAIQDSGAKRSKAKTAK